MVQVPKVKIIGETSADKIKIEQHIIELIKGRLNVIKEELKIIEEDLNFFTRKHNFTNEEFLDKFNHGVLGDDEEFFVWEGSLKLRNDLLEEESLLRDAL